MGITLGSNFDVQTALPLDSRLVVADSTARDAIDALQRYEGMLVYVTADATNYQLVGGILNANWTELAGAGGGGGGGSITWYERALAAFQTFLGDIKAHIFYAADTQYLYTMIKVPASYSAGGPIKLLAKWVSNDTSGNVLFTTVATLIRSTDTYSSTTNQRTSTNSAVTVSGATQDIPQAIEFDLTSSIGEINSVAVSPGDLIKVRLTRGSDTATSGAYFYTDATEVTFV